MSSIAVQQPQQGLEKFQYICEYEGCNEKTDLFCQKCEVSYCSEQHRLNLHQEPCRELEGLLQHRVRDNMDSIEPESLESMKRDQLKRIHNQAVRAFYFYDAKRTHEEVFFQLGAQNTIRVLAELLSN